MTVYETERFRIDADGTEPDARTLVITCFCRFCGRELARRVFTVEEYVEHDMCSDYLEVRMAALYDALVALRHACPVRVTDLLASLGFIDSDHYTDESRDRGTVVHAVLAYYDSVDSGLTPGERENNLRRATLPEWVWPFLDAYKLFLADAQPETLAVELELDGAGVVGHADRLWQLNGRRGIGDLKTGGPASWHILQLAAYAALSGDWCNGWNLYLQPGKPQPYRLIPHSVEDMIAAGKTFRAALEVYRWKQKQTHRL